MINLKFLKSKKGLTLVELLVGCALLAVLTSVLVIVFVPMVNMQIKVKELAELNGLLDNLANPIVKDISKTFSSPVITGTENDIQISVHSLNDVAYTVDSDGILLRNGLPVYSKSFYKDKSIKFVCDTASVSGEAYNLTVTIISDSDNTEIISREYAVKPLSLNQYLH